MCVWTLRKKNGDYEDDGDDNANEDADSQQNARKYSPKNTVNEEKLRNNLIRARNKVLEYALCNEWEWFFTTTIDGNKYDRSDLATFQKDFTRMLQKIGRDNHTKIHYLIVPELHADRKNWHAHGFIKGLPKNYLTKFELNMKLPLYLIRKIRGGCHVYEMKAYTEKFGFNDFEKIRDLRRSANYICKYITKGFGDRSVSELGKHLYFASKGLNTAKEIYRGTPRIDTPINYDYTNEYVGIKWLDADEDYKKYMEQEIVYDEWIPLDEFDRTPFD